MSYATVLTSLALALLALACNNTGECGESDRGCVDPETASATDVTPTGSTGAPTTSGTPTTTGDSPTTTTDVTTGGSGELMRCQPKCSGDADCMLQGMDGGFTCTDGECTFPACVADEQCRVLYSGWSDDCEKTDDCAGGEACIAVDGGVGLCATLSSPRFNCADFGLVEFTRTALEGGDVTVCGREAFCKDQLCTLACQNDAGCPADLGTPHCEVDTGRCTCMADAECQATGQPGYAACLDGRCGCNVDADCAGGTNVDTCVDGACGCSSTAICSVPIFDNVDLVCEVP